MASGCTHTHARKFLGYEVRKLFEQTGVKVTETLISIIDPLLTKYVTDIPTKFDSPELIRKIYSEARELYNMKSESRKIV